MENPCSACHLAMRNEELRVRVGELLTANTRFEQDARDARSERDHLRKCANRERSIGAELWISAVIGIAAQISAVASLPETPAEVRARLTEIVGEMEPKS